MNSHSLRTTLVVLTLLVGSVALQFAQEGKREVGTLVSVEINAPKGKTPYPREVASWGNEAYCVVQLSSHVHDNSLFYIPESGPVCAATLQDGTALTGQVLTLVQRAPYVFRRQDEVRGYFSLAHGVATPVAFPEGTQLGRFNQSFLPNAPELFWDAGSRSLYRIDNGVATRVEQDVLKDVSDINACRIKEGHLVVEVLHASTRKPRAWILGAAAKLSPLEIPCEAPIAFSGLAVTSGSCLVYAGRSEDAAIFEYQALEFKPLTDDQGALLKGIRTSSIMAAGDTVYFCRTDDTGMETLWAREDDGSLAPVSGVVRARPGTLYFPHQTNSSATAVIRNGDGHCWLIRERKAVQVIDADGSPLSAFSEATVMDTSAWLLCNDDSEQNLYFVDVGGRACFATLPGGARARADRSIQRNGRTAEIREGMSIEGGGSEVFCRRWDQGGCTLYRLGD